MPILKFPHTNCFTFVAVLRRALESPRLTNPQHLLTCAGGLGGPLAGCVELHNPPHNGRLSVHAEWAVPSGLPLSCFFPTATIQQNEEGNISWKLYICWIFSNMVDSAVRQSLPRFSNPGVCSEADTHEVAHSCWRPPPPLVALEGCVQGEYFGIIIICQVIIHGGP